MQVVTRTSGSVVDVVDRTGAVFVPVAGATNPVWVPKNQHPDDPMAMFTCPVSAIPWAVFELLWLWMACRRMKTLPKAGGFLDQPLIVRRAFPIFEAEMAVLDRRSEGQSAAVAMSSMLARMFGGQA